MKKKINTVIANTMIATNGRGLTQRKRPRKKKCAGAESSPESQVISKSGTSAPKQGRKIRNSYDAVAKSLIQHKIILANVLKYGIEEFSEYSVPELEKCIEDVYELDSKAVDPDTPDADSKFVCVNTEDSSSADGRVTYDILFNVRHPGAAGKVLLMINVEIQPVEKLGYHLISRSIYYMARLISQQKNTVFSSSDYDSIRKVYSLWLRPALHGKNSLVEFGLEAIRNFGPAAELDEEFRQYYDKMRIAIITFSNEDSENREKIVKFLSALLIDDKILAERRKILEHEFSIPMTREISEELELMGSMSSAIAKWHMEEGLAKGREEGREEMRKEMQGQVLAGIRSLMDSFHISAEDAMKRMSIPETDQEAYLKLLGES